MIPFYPPLDVQTDADPLAGVCTPDGLVRAAVRRGVHHLGTADHATLQAIEPIAALGRRQGVRPLAGATLTIRHPGEAASTLLLYATSGGWENLVALCAMPSVSTEALAAHARGLVAITGIRGSRLWHFLRLGRPWDADIHLKELAVIFGAEGLFVALGNSPHATAQRMRQASFESATRSSVPCVTLPTIRHIDAKGFVRFDAVHALNGNRTINSSNRPTTLTDWAFWKDDRELANDYLDVKGADPKGVLALAERLESGVPDWVGSRQSILAAPASDHGLLRQRANRFLEKPENKGFRSVFTQEIEFLKENGLDVLFHRSVALLDIFRAHGVRARFSGDIRTLNLSAIHNPGQQPRDFNPYPWFNPLAPAPSVIQIEVDASRMDYAAEMAGKGAHLSTILTQTVCTGREAIEKAGLLSRLNLEDTLTITTEFEKETFSLTERKSPEGPGFNRAAINAVILARAMVGRALTPATPSGRFAFLPPDCAIPYRIEDDRKALVWAHSGAYLSGEIRLEASRALLEESIVTHSGGEVPVNPEAEIPNEALTVLAKAGLAVEEVDAARRAIVAHRSEEIFQWQRRFDDAAVAKGMDLTSAQDCFNAVVKKLQAAPTQKSEALRLGLRDRVLATFEERTSVSNLIPQILAAGLGILPPNWEAPQFLSSWEGDSVRLGLHALLGAAAHQVLATWPNLPLEASAASQWHEYFDKHAPGLWEPLAAGGWLPAEVITASPMVFIAWGKWGWTWPLHPHDPMLIAGLEAGSRQIVTFLTERATNAWGDHGRVVTGEMASLAGEKRYLVEPDPRQKSLLGQHAEITGESLPFGFLVKQSSSAEPGDAIGLILEWPEGVPPLPEETRVNLEKSALQLPHKRLSVQMVRRQASGSMEDLGRIEGARSIWWWRGLNDYLPQGVGIEMAADS